MGPRSDRSQSAHPALEQIHVETAPPPEPDHRGTTAAASFWLVILWSAREPQRVGHSAFCAEGRTHLLGRAPQAKASEAPLRFAAVRPDEAGGVVAGGDPVLGESVSRRQLEIVVERDRLLVRNVGRCPLWINGELASRAEVGHGDVIYLQQQLLLLCVSRPATLPSLCGYPQDRLGEFGSADADGLVGESYPTWELRRQLGQYGPSDGHVLIVGGSGVGKELVARALHQLSRQRRQAFIAENIATIPPNLGTALLFGNRRNFPNPGMEERVGLIGHAEGGTLFLDEIGDMSLEAQPLLLRVMERDGDYVRLGDETQLRRANVRFIAATNHPDRLRPELRRRFLHEIHIPSLDERREDIPLLIRHILITRAAKRPSLAAFLHNGQPRVEPLFVEQLVRHAYSTHVSELAFLVEQAAADCGQQVLRALPPHVLHRRSEPIVERLGSNKPAPSEAPIPSAPTSGLVLPSAEDAQRALDWERGNVAQAATRLGISRHALNRLIRRHTLRVRRSTASSDSSSGEDES
ncbi:MAG TPA: sigma 54-interacting transcriptional regulator [Pseudomonadota bacterium]|nr:sigma 54-interacting transcriptional regulator [Pseudomonadota bacterium]